MEGRPELLISSHFAFFHIHSFLLVFVLCFLVLSPRDRGCIIGVGVVRFVILSLLREAATPGWRQVWAVQLYIARQNFPCKCRVRANILTRVPNFLWPISKWNLLFLLFWNGLWFGWGLLWTMHYNNNNNNNNNLFFVLLNFWCFHMQELFTTLVSKPYWMELQI